MSSSKFLIDIAGNPKLERLVSSGGVALWLEALRRGRVLRQLSFSVAGQQSWTDGQMMMVMLLNIQGYDRVVDVEDLEQDSGLCRLIGHHDFSVLGISQKRLGKRFRKKGGRQRAFPSESSLHDWLVRFQDEEAGQKRVAGQAMVPRPSDVEEGMGLSHLDTVALVRFAHERCGHGEEIHAVLKRDMAGGLLPLGRFGVNAAWWALMACSVNLTALLRHSGAFGKDGPWMRMKRLRLRWFF